jgi:hypothetical protein
MKSVFRVGTAHPVKCQLIIGDGREAKDKDDIERLE